MTIRDYFVSVIRTVSPLVAGYLLTLAARANLDLDSSTTVMFVFALLTGSYHALVRALEARWPAVGVLLGWPVMPQYPVSVESSNGKI